VSDVHLRGIGMTSQRTRDRMVQRLREQGIVNERVLDVMREIPRHLFLDEALAHRAYEDSALPIGYNQTLSQPYIVARMTELLVADGPLGKVLEVGGGSGYQTAVLARFAQQVISIERIKPLQDRARERLRLLGIRNVQLRHGDGTLGLAQAAPYDGILCAAAPTYIPQELIDQLAPGGRLVLPVGDGDEQVLTQVTRLESGVRTQSLERVRFVPMLGGTVK
jgi:protein-L-isoaspartate(D-aspartate) O-methyltransferase